jgi:hypothetical protein
LLGLASQNSHRAHFLENHDEPRIASRVDDELHRAATALIMGLPGMRFLHEGEFDGARRFARVQLARRAVEPVDESVKSIYAQLLPAFAESCVGKGDGRLLQPRRAWDDNPTSQCFTAVQWMDPNREDQFDLVVVNLAPHRAQCRVDLDLRVGGAWHLSDRLGSERWIREADDMKREGLFLDLPSRGAQLFSFRRA